MYHSNFLSLALFLAAAHHSYALPQIPEAAATPCLTKIALGYQDELMATPASNSVILEIRKIQFVASSYSTETIATSTLLPDAPAIPVATNHAIALNGATGNIVLDGNEFIFSNEIQCPRLIVPIDAPGEATSPNPFGPGQNPPPPSNDPPASDDPSSRKFRA